MRVKKFYNGETVFADNIIEIELRDGSRLVLRDDRQPHTNCLRISSGGGGQGWKAEGLTIIPDCANSLILFTCPLGTPSRVSDHEKKYRDQ
jgi:hypothetical protein